MKYFATVKSHGEVGCWEELSAKSLAVAKREATRRFGGGLLGGVIHLVECQTEADEKMLNDLPAYTKRIESYATKWESGENEE